jgi:hypothetical protein
LVSITFPDSVTVLGAYVVSQCYSLTDVTLPNSIDTISEMMFAACTSLSTITLPESITSIGDIAFSLCHELEKITIPESVTTIGSRAFEYCEKLTSLVIPKNVTSIGSNAFIRCQSLRKIYFVGNAPAISADAFGPNDGEYWECVVATAYYPVGNETWSNDVLQNYGGTITWQTWNPAKSSVVLDGLGLENVKSVWIDGVEYPLTVSGGHLTVYFPDTSATNLVVYSYNDSNPADIHTQYPTGMRVWRLTQNADGTYSATYVKELDNILQYAGSSIRITGTKGIRMITSITKSNKTALTGKGLAGYKLVEYGTALCWAKDLEGGKPMVLGQDYVKSNYAYKRGVADPIFAQTKDLVQYTNVLVGFNIAQCSDDIAMRPYIILEDAAGNRITLYGGTIYRSIGYIAYQNRTVFKPKTASYNYVWELIHHVYGDKYDAD